MPNVNPTSYWFLQGYNDCLAGELPAEWFEGDEETADYNEGWAAAELELTA